MTADLDTAIDMVDNEDIIDIFGVPKQVRNNKVYILCPGHDDKRFGSCYLDQKAHSGYFCYACGKWVSKFHMVQQITGWDNKETAKWFFDTAGVEPDHPKKEEDDSYRKVIPVIKSLKKYLGNEPLYDDICPCEKKESTYGRTLNGDYMVSKLAISNPLLELYKADRTMFRNIVLRQLNRKVNKFCRLLAKMNREKKRRGRSNDFLDGVSDACVSNINELMVLRDRVFAITQ